MIGELIKFIRDIASIAAIGIAGWWGYYLYKQKRQKYPRANISHEISHKQIGNNKLFLHVVVKMENVGDVMLSLTTGETIIYQILPLTGNVLEAIRENRNLVNKDETEIEWHLLAKKERKWDKEFFEIEPCERDRIIFDFILDDSIKTIGIYSHFMNEKKRERELGWTLTTIYEI